MESVRINIDNFFSLEVEPENLENEKFILYQILDDFQNMIPNDEIVSKYSEVVTKWIAWQLGLVTSYLIELNRTSVEIIRISWLSIELAGNGNWLEVEGENLNILVLYLMQFESYDLIESICKRSLEKIGSRHQNNFIISNYYLGIIKSLEKNNLGAIEYFDTLFEFLVKNELTEQFKDLTHSAVSSYSDVNDLAGIIVLTRVSKGEKLTFELTNKISKIDIDKLSISQKINLYNRLTKFGLETIAKLIKSK